MVSEKTKSSSMANAVTAKDFAGLLMALLAVTLAASFLLNFSSKQETAYELLSHTHEVFHDSQVLLLSSAKADMCVRNYLLTKNDRYRTQYSDTRGSLKSELKILGEQIKSPAGQLMLKTQLTPALVTFILASDTLLKKDSASPRDLEQQESAKDSLLSAIATMQQRQVQLITERSEHLAQLSESVARARFLTFFVALTAVILSLFTWRLVMKKDKSKIESLEKEIQNTLTAEKRAYDALAIADKSNQLKTEFIANISHEIRTPMTGILGAAELLSGMPLDENAKPMNKLLLDNSRQLLGVLNDLLNFSKLQRKEIVLHPEPFAIKQMVDETIAKMAEMLGDKPINLTAKIDATLPPIILADEEKIRQVLNALLSNAVKFTNEGCIELNIDYATTGQIRIAVLDTGIGINQESSTKLFQPFVQIDGSITRNIGGSGLGLFLARQYVELMSGEIGVSSEPGMGSIFWFTFASEAAIGKVKSLRRNRQITQGEDDPPVPAIAPKAS